MAKIVQKFTRNLAGRDFIFGDIHGAFDLLDQALVEIKFDASIDRIFLLGDLVDRGRFSPRCEEFLKRPSVISLRGNHEQIFLDMFADGEPNARELAFHVQKNGLAWALALDESAKSRICDLFKELPLAIELETSTGTVGLVHAEVPMGCSWTDFVMRLEAGHNATIQCAIWARSRNDYEEDGIIEGIDRVFCGHSIQADAKKLGNVFFIDTGAFKNSRAVGGGFLTVVDAESTEEQILAPTPYNTAVAFKGPGGLPVESPFSLTMGSIVKSLF